MNPRLRALIVGAAALTMSALLAPSAQAAPVDKNIDTTRSMTTYQAAHIWCC